jgi:riboflavin synthase
VHVSETVTENEDQESEEKELKEVTVENNSTKVRYNCLKMVQKGFCD